VGVKRPQDALKRYYKFWKDIQHDDSDFWVNRVQISLIIDK